MQAREDKSAWQWLYDYIQNTLAIYKANGSPVRSGIKRTADRELRIINKTLQSMGFNNEIQEIRYKTSQS